ncbi:MAG TPA: hypothetical protein VM840_04275 [Actinomycetota bacterium]|nr:hypothetical protein [Actinomycetota bacterium]
MRTRIVSLVVVLLGTLALTPSVQAAAPCDTVAPDRWMSDHGIGSTSDDKHRLPSGRYALPETAEPEHLVVMMHGWQNNSCSWRNHLRRVAGHGAVAVAMDYTGQDPVTNRGWHVSAGAKDSIVAAKRFLDLYPSIETVTVFAISMGANTAGLALADPDAVREDGSPLFDRLVAVEGVHNFTQLYAIAVALKGSNASAAAFVTDAEAETGGALHEVPERYLHLTNVVRAPEMAYLEGAVLVHGVDDGTVPGNQSREMTNALRAVGVPAELHTVVGRGSGRPGTTFSSTFLGVPWSGTGMGAYPTAGHGWEGDPDHLVIKTGFERLFALLDGGAVEPYHEAIELGLPPELGLGS